VEGGPVSCFDWLAVHDGPDPGSNLIGKFCGSRLPGENGTILSTRNSVLLAFRSDHSVGSSFVLLNKLKLKVNIFRENIYLLIVFPV
jgi:CUB domain